VLFLYEGDSYYDLSDWTKFESRVATVPELKVVKLSRIEVMKICPRRCDRDSHGAVWGDGFEGAHYDAYLQPMLDRIREEIKSRSDPAQPAR
jgi:hypothetical protein